MDRRSFIRQNICGLGAASLASGGAAAIRSKETNPENFVFARLRYVTRTAVANRWDVHPYADDLLLDFVERVSNLKIERRPFMERYVDLDNITESARFPFVFMTGEGDFRFSPKQRKDLAEFINRGGFMYADDCVIDKTSDFFFQAILREFKLVFPGQELKPVPPDHEIYKCFFKFPGRAPFFQGTPHPDMGLFIKDRLAVFLTAGDVHCAWAGYPKRNPRPKLQEDCFKMGMNIILYALTH